MVLGCCLFLVGGGGGGGNLVFLLVSLQYQQRKMLQIPKKIRVFGVCLVEESEPQNPKCWWLMVISLVDKKRGYLNGQGT